MARAELAAALRRDLDDEHAWSVFGDLLTEVGDRRGELIALEQRAASCERAFERSLLEHQARELFDALERGWLGSLADAGLEVGWRRGFAIEVVVARAHASTLARLLELPSAALLQRLVVVRPRSLTDVVRALADRPDRPIDALVIRNPVESSFEPLAALRSLTTLTLEGVDLEGLDALAALPELRSLTLRRCAGAPAGLAAGFADLRSLELSAHAGVEQLDVAALDVLARLRALTRLDLSDAGWPHIDAVAELIELERLDLRSTEVTDLAPLRGLTALRELDCSGCTGLSDLSPLAGLTRLERLRVGYTRVRDLRPLAKLERLRTVDLAGTPTTRLDPLVSLPALSRVNVEACEVGDVAPLLARGVAVHGVRPPERSWREIAEDYLRSSE
jgi:hypothetical protein